MKKQIQYRVLKYEYFNEYGGVTCEYFYIEKFSKNWLGIWRWRKIKHYEYHSMDVTKFQTQKDAEDHINDILCPGLITSDSKSSVVSTFKCDDK